MKTYEDKFSFYWGEGVANVVRERILYTYIPDLPPNGRPSLNLFFISLVG